LTPGIYTFSVGVTISSNIYFEGIDGDDDIFIIQIAGILMQATGTRLFLLNGELTKDIVWQSSGFRGQFLFNQHAYVRSPPLPFPPLPHSLTDNRSVYERAYTVSHHGCTHSSTFDAPHCIAYHLSHSLTDNRSAH
jgi:hypothetical protein